MSAGTTRRTVRIENELWDRAKDAAEANDDNLSEVLREALKAYIAASKP